MPAGQVAVQPEKKSSWGCLKILLIVAGVIGALFLIFAIMVWNVFSWIGNAAEPTPTTYPAVVVSEGEKEDVDRIIGQLATAKHNQTVVDEYVTPNVFNAVMEKIMEGERAKGKTDANTAVRIEFKGEDTDLKFTGPADDKNAGKQYVNAEIVGNIEIVEGKLTRLDIKHMRLKNQEAPWLVRFFFDKISDAVKQQSGQSNAQGKNDLEMVKLLKREGDRLHFVLDGAKFKDDEK